MTRVASLITVLLLAVAAQAAQAELAAHSLLSAGRVDVAIADLQSHLRSTPNDAEAYYLLCRAYYGLQQWDEAISAAQKAIGLDPNNSKYHMWLGRSYGEKAERSSWFSAIGLARKVHSEFEKAVQLDGRNLAAQADLAEYYVDAPSFLGGGKDKARAQAEKLAPMSAATAHWVRAQVAEKESNWGVAEDEYHAAIKASGNEASYWLNLASFYRHRGQFKEMEEAISSASKAQINKNDVWVDAADLLYRAGRNYPQAAQFLERYLSSNATTEDAPAFQAHYLLGSVLEKQGDKQHAADQYRAALALAQNFSPAQQALDRLNH